MFYYNFFTADYGYGTGKSKYLKKMFKLKKRYHFHVQNKNFAFCIKKNTHNLGTHRNSVLNI